MWLRRKQRRDQEVVADEEQGLMDAESIGDGGEESVSRSPKVITEDMTVPEILVQQLKPLLEEMEKRKKEYPKDDSTRKRLSEGVEELARPGPLLKTGKNDEAAKRFSRLKLDLVRYLKEYNVDYDCNLDVENISRNLKHLDLIINGPRHRKPEKKESETEIGLRKKVSWEGLCSEKGGSTAASQYSSSLRYSSSSNKPSLIITSRHGSGRLRYELEHSLTPTPILSNGEQSKVLNRLSLCTSPSRLREFADNPGFQEFRGTLLGALSYLEEPSGAPESTIAATEAATDTLSGAFSSDTSHVQPLGGEEELERMLENWSEEGKSQFSTQKPLSLV